MRWAEVIEGLYVSEDGRLFRDNGDLCFEATYHLHGGSKDRKYLYVVYRGKKYDVHRQVAIAFLPNPYDLPLVCHRDDNTFNNDIDNLYWGTHRENQRDYYSNLEVTP